MRIETWVSNKGDEEIQHFIEDSNTYVFGFNEKLLGTDLYNTVLQLVASRVKELGSMQPTSIEEQDDYVRMMVEEEKASLT